MAQGADAGAWDYAFHFLGYASVAGSLGIGAYIFNSPNETGGRLKAAMHSSGAMRWFCMANSNERTTDTDSVELEPLNSINSTKDAEVADPRPPAPTVQVTNPVALFVFCFFGLQVSYLSWGYIQERIMTLDYDGERFQYSEMLVFLNRFLAMVLAYAVLLVRPSQHGAPPFKYTITSCSNVISSWLQYEALKFVTFPLQVLAKSSKILFAMLMGKVVQGKSFSWAKYLNATLIMFGIAIFRLYQEDEGAEKSKKNADIEHAKFTFGACLLLGYVLCDSFTSNWQAAVFKAHKVNSYQMMLGVNVASCCVVLSMLLFQGTFLPAVNFLLAHPLCSGHAFMMSVFAAIGQLFIYYTIEKFGAVAFASIMTARQFFSILLSIFSFGHSLSGGSVVGLTLVFVALVCEVLAKRK